MSWTESLVTRRLESFQPLSATISLVPRELMISQTGARRTKAILWHHETRKIAQERMWNPWQNTFAANALHKPLWEPCYQRHLLVVRGTSAAAPSVRCRGKRWSGLSYYGVISRDVVDLHSLQLCFNIVGWATNIYP